MDLGKYPEKQNVIFNFYNFETGCSWVNTPPPPPPHLFIKQGTSFSEPFRKVKWGIKLGKCFEK